jgi:lysozyme
MNRDRTISNDGIELIESFEGLRLQAYRDIRGILTIGFGHTRGVREGDQITREDAEAFLRDDLSAAENCVRDAVNMVRLTQHQFDALVSFVFNIGCTAFHNSATLRCLEIGDFIGAAEGFSHFTRAGLQHPLGLVRRREAEAKWFGTPD